MHTKALLMALLFCSTASLADNLHVERVQLPAWVIRAGHSQPVTAGMQLRSNDVLRTGAGARLLLRMNEGSSIKLGENGELALGTLGADASDKGLFRAALNVASGAFRYTTDLLAKKKRRDVSIRVATVTVGIRGTDVWGKAAADKDIVCLLEGRIEVGKDGYTTVQMDQPNSFYIAPRTGDPLPIAAVPPEKLQQWALETEVGTGQPVLQPDGRWTLNVIDVRSQRDALGWYDRLRAAGYPARIRPAGRVWHVRIGGLADEAAATALAERLQKEFGVSGQDIIGG